MSGEFHLFVYGSLRRQGTAAALLSAAEWIGEGSVGGVLYDVDEYRTLVLYGNTPVEGEVWRCPFELLAELDRYERVEEGLFRRVGVQVQMKDGTRPGCWAYVAGPKLSRKLTSGRRINVL
jgi:gamma-glutamylcyclotransferase (GGCT)/AIG2-like uncharacterized protein YtfP